MFTTPASSFVPILIDNNIRRYYTPGGFRAESGRFFASDSFLRRIHEHGDEISPNKQGEETVERALRFPDPTGDGEGEIKLRQVMWKIPIPVATSSGRNGIPGDVRESGRTRA